MNWRDGTHPLWSILRMAVVFAAGIITLHVTATHFDLGEIKAAGTVALLTAVFDIAKRFTTS